MPNVKSLQQRIQKKKNKSRVTPRVSLKRKTLFKKANDDEEVITTTSDTRLTRDIEAGGAGQSALGIKLGAGNVRRAFPGCRACLITPYGGKGARGKPSRIQDVVAGM